MKVIARLIKDRFGVDHHHDHVGVILHALGVTPRVPDAGPFRKADQPS